MKALRLILTQSSANYKKEEVVDNKMTYPLPPISTIIGALHNICNYHEYKEMDISIQGKYESMHREPYTDYCFLNSVQDDRGVLVKMKNGDLLSNAFERVASAQKPQGNSFRTGKTIMVHNQKLLDEYRDLKDLNDEIDKFNKEKLQKIFELIKKRKKTLADKKKNLDKKSEKYIEVINREKEIKELEKEIKTKRDQFKEKNYTTPISQYRSLTTSLKFYEILDNITLILHVRASDEVLQDILDHIYDLRSLGRSEDTVNVENAEIVDLLEDTDEDEIYSQYSSYLDYDLIKEERIYPYSKKNRISGTRYYLNKNYKIENGKRIFSKRKVVFTSNYVVEEFGEGLYLDQYGDQAFIVNFL